MVLISGFSLPLCGFHTPYRVHNIHVCHGCWDATDMQFDHKYLKDNGGTAQFCLAHLVRELRFLT